MVQLEFTVNVLSALKSAFSALGNLHFTGGLSFINQSINICDVYYMSDHNQWHNEKYIHIWKNVYKQPGKFDITKEKQMGRITLYGNQCSSVQWCGIVILSIRGRHTYAAKNRYCPSTKDGHSRVSLLQDIWPLTCGLQVSGECGVILTLTLTLI